MKVTQAPNRAKSQHDLTGRMLGLLSFWPHAKPVTSRSD